MATTEPNWELGELDIAIEEPDMLLDYAVEAALLTSPEPLPMRHLVKLLGVSDDETLDEPPRALRERILRVLARLQRHWNSRGLRLAEVASGWRFQTSDQVSQRLSALKSEKAPKYSRATLETLAIIAYRQPVTRGDIEDLRGVAVNPIIIKTLEAREWIECIGHKEVPGRPALFATTKKFLDDLGLVQLTDLPAVEGLNALIENKRNGS